MSTLRVKLEDLKRGVRYSFKDSRHGDDILEGTLDWVKPLNDNEEYQYGFSNIVKYNPDTKIQKRIGATMYNNPDRYPYDFFVVAFTELPSDLNSYINAFGKKRKSTQRKRKSNLRKIKSNLRSKRYRK
jgi:hypothetical protein